LLLLLILSSSLLLLHQWWLRGACSKYARNYNEKCWETRLGSGWPTSIYRSNEWSPRRQKNGSRITLAGRRGHRRMALVLRTLYITHFCITNRRKGRFFVVYIIHIVKRYTYGASRIGSVAYGLLLVPLQRAWSFWKHLSSQPRCTRLPTIYLLLFTWTTLTPTRCSE
jgi:hypothetical protein